MQFNDKKITKRWIVIITSFFIVSIILWNTYSFFKIFKNEERIKMEQWALAQNTLEKADLDTDVNLPLRIFQDIKIPVIKTINDSIVDSANIDDKIESNPTALKDYLKYLKTQNEPIVQIISKTKKQYLYYGDSSLLNKLKYYPIALLLIIFLFGTVVYNFYSSSKTGEQNKLWAGMVKETAHQIGTPLSSLMGWLEILKLEENIDETIIVEIEKDIVRLQTITERFSKIGSEPVLEKTNIIEATQNTFEYLKKRYSNQVAFTFETNSANIFTEINPTLHSWTIENLMKNAIDAMKGKGKLHVKIYSQNNLCKIEVTDTGKGIELKNFKRIFETGYTTKKRGWGLGLSLTKRIVEKYHKGKIKVIASEINKGTTIQITYPISNKM